MFAVVTCRDSNTVDVVPTSWLLCKDGKEKLSLFPPLSGNALEEAVKMLSTPKKSWKAYQIQMKGKFDSYEEADKMAQAETFKSDTDRGSGVEDDRFNRHSRHKRKAEGSLSDSDDDARHQGKSLTTKKNLFPSMLKGFPKPPTRLPKNLPMQTVLDSVESDDICDLNIASSQTAITNSDSTANAAAASRNDVTHNKNLEDSATTPRSFKTNNTSREISTLENNTPSHSAMNPDATRKTTTPQQTLPNARPCSSKTPESLSNENSNVTPQVTSAVQYARQLRFERLVVNKLDELNEKLNTAVNLLMQSTAAHQSNVRTHENELPEGINLPLASVQTVLELEEALRNNDIKIALTNTLARCGGEDEVQTVRRILRSLMKNEVAVQYNWMGKGEKYGFSKLALKDVVIRAVRQNPLTANATDNTIEVLIKKWLQFAKDREGGRMARARAKLNANN